MHKTIVISPIRRVSGVSLLEVMFASVVLGIMFLAIIGTLQMHRIESRKAMQQAIMLDFAEHYLEIARGQDFDKIYPGGPINALFNGASGALDVRFPANNNYVDLLATGTDWQNFHPELAWLTGQTPQMSIQINNQTVGATARSKHIGLRLRWRPPLGRGADWLTLEMDTVVYSEFH